jgi:hypothetical protein
MNRHKRRLFESTSWVFVWLMGVAIALFVLFSLARGAGTAVFLVLVLGTIPIATYLLIRRP